MTDLDIEISSICISDAADERGETDGEDSRPILASGFENGANHSLSIETLWEVLQPTAAIF